MNYFVSIIVLYFSLLPFCLGFGIEDFNLTECFNSFNKNCCKGYHLINDECVPICKGGCPESQVCLKPSVCGIENRGYPYWRKYCARRRSDDQTNYCGKCYPLHVPNKKNDFYECQPYCDQKCTNGFCDLPGICKCNPGYQENPQTKACEPINLFNSPEDCVNESCQEFSTIDVEFSTIDVDFTTSTIDNNLNCQNDCRDGICIDGLCQEHTSSIEEHTSISTTDVTLNCLHGFCIEEEIPDLRPAIDVTSNCQNGCWGGMCYKGVCQCKDGLILNEESNDCIMPCESTCQNGVCNQDRICKCNQGYIFQNNSGCVPQCDRECVNSICAAPIHCECIEGDISRLNISSALECYPTCDGVDDKIGCLNGTCVAVNKCQCLDGFVAKPDDRFECVASLADTGGLLRKFSYLLISIIVVLTVATLIVLGLLAYKRMRRVSYDIDEIEKIHSTVVFQNQKHPECTTF